jgi:hypothetical protein
MDSSLYIYMFHAFNLVNKYSLKYVPTQVPKQNNFLNPMGSSLQNDSFLWRILLYMHK